ncbi:MAG: P-loop NTPase fold protein [Gammaproteobacteria bacterium]
MPERQVCPTRLIDDSPAPEDGFRPEAGAGPHERVAAAIVDLIDSTEAGGKVIGLEGSWGAGKSTVVNFVQARLEAKPAHAVIMFDAWAHEGDPLRRTYLETLIHRMKDLGWVSVAEWKRRLDEIACRRKTTITRTTPKPTTLGTFLAVALLLVPFGTAFMGAALREGITLDPRGSLSWKFLVGLLSVAPLFVLCANAFFLLLREPLSLRRPFTLRRIRSLDSWAFLEGKAISEMQTETVETPNPTSLEFEKHFGDLMREALHRQPDRRVVLVLDNLDRVDPKEALEIWSTLQTFVRYRFDYAESWYQQLWVLLPYDPTGLRKLWDNYDRRTPEANSDGSLGLTTQSFLDKSLQIRFQVPPPVLSDWQAFLYRLVKQALPDHDENDQHAIYRVFDVCRGTTGSPPTPRELKLYVNQIGAIHRQWQHEFPIDHVAYYVLLCGERQTVAQGLRQAVLPAPDASRLMGESLRDSLAGLAFNVPAKLGQQLLLAEPIFDALCQDSPDRLLELVATHGRGFWVVLEKVAASKIAMGDASVLAKVAISLSQSSLLVEAGSRVEARTTLKALASAARSVESWTPFDLEMAKGIAALCALAAEKPFSKHLASKVGIAVAAPAKQKGVEPASIAECVRTVLAAIEKLGHAEALDTLTLPLDVNGWIAVCDAMVADWPPSLWKLVRPSAEFPEIETKLTEAINGDQFGQAHLHTIRVTGSGPLTCNWKGIAVALRGRLQAGQNVAPKPDNWLLRGLTEIRAFGDTNAASVLKALADEGHLLHHLQRAKAEENPDAVAWSMFCFLRERQEAAKPAQVGDSEAGFAALRAYLGSEDEGLSDKLLTLLEEWDETGVLFRARSKYDPLIRMCLRKVADGPSAEHLFSPDDVLERWSSLKDVLDNESNPNRFLQLIKRLAESRDLCQRIMTRERGFVADEIALYLAVLASAGCPASDFVEWCKSGLEGLSVESWRASLRADCSAIRFVLELREQRIDLTLSHGFSDAIEDHARSVAKREELPPDDLRSRWIDVLSMLPNPTREVLRARILDVAIERDGNIGHEFYQIYGSELSNAAALLSNARSVSHVFSPIVRQRDAAGMRWLAQTLRDNDDFLETYSNTNSLQDFKGRVQECLEQESDEESSELIQEIASLLRIPFESRSDKADGLGSAREVVPHSRSDE